MNKTHATKIIKENKKAINEFLKKYGFCDEFEIEVNKVDSLDYKLYCCLADTNEFLISLIKNF